MRGSLLSMAALTGVLCLAGCGDYYRPVANPIPQQGGPQPAKPSYALVVSNTGANTQGFVTTYNLPGDSNMGQAPVGKDAVYGMTPDGTRGLIANRGEDSLSFVFPITTPNAAIVNTIALQPNSAPTFVTASGTSAWVVAPGRNGKAPVLGIVSLASNSETTETPVGSNPVFAVFDQASQKVYVVNQGSSDVTIISSRDNSVITTLPVGSGPTYAVVGTNGNIFVLNTGANTVTQIDGNFDTIPATLTVGNQPVAAAYDTNARKLIVANKASNSVSIIDADPASATYLRVSNVNVGTAPVSVAILTTSNRAAIANSGSNDVTIVDTLANRVIVPSIPVGASPISVSAASDGSKLLVASGGSSSVTFIETKTYTVTSTLAAPPTPVNSFPTP